MRYPGLASHPTHEAARRQLKGFGTIISFDVRGDASAADAVCAGVQLIQHATSLGAVESTIERRASISWAGAPASDAAAAERWYRGHGGPLDRSGSRAAQRAGSVVLDAEPNGLDVLAPSAHAIAATQQDNGGWSTQSLRPWERVDSTDLDAATDAYATGLVTLALQHAGIPRTDSRVNKAISVRAVFAWVSGVDDFVATKSSGFNKR